MNKRVASYNFSLFGNFNYIVANDKARYKQLEKLFDDEFLLTIENQIRVELKIVQGQSPVPTNNKIMKPFLFNANNTKEIKFKDNRIDFVVYYEKDKSLKLDESIIQNVQQYFDRLISVYDLKVNRIAFNLTSNIFDFVDSELINLQKKFITPNITFYKENEIDRWGMQLIKKIEVPEIDSKVNVVLSSKKILLENETSSISVDYDINTDELNQDKIFEKEQIKSFVNEASKIYFALRDELENGTSN